ncbi:MAG: tetratricopeptide repeat protein [Rhizobacter sp.]|nr:tetratricopeptide repeat protein [Rhizobacter sp.]
MARHDPLAAARARLLALGADHEAGKIDARRYDQERRKVEHEIGALLMTEAPTQVRPSLRLVGVLSLAVLALAVFGYSRTGAPSLAWPGAAPVEAAASAAADRNAMQQIQGMVDQLAERLKKNPGDAQGWVMLARSYTVLGRFDEALPAYAKAVELVPANAQILADYAYTVAATKGTANNPQSIVLIDRALAADAKHPKALALAGTVAFERGDYAKAVADWQKILDQLPPGNEFGERIQASIGEARERAAAAGTALSPASGVVAARGQGPTAATTAAATATTTTEAAKSSAVSGTVTLDPALAAQASPDDALFVFARPAGGRMPLAVLRKTVRDLPLTFTLDDSMAMSPAARLSSASEVTVGARISKSGTAIPRPGDLAGEATGVKPGATGVAVRIGSVVGKP